MSTDMTICHISHRYNISLSEVDLNVEETINPIKFIDPFTEMLPLANHFDLWLQRERQTSFLRIISSYSQR